MSALGLLGWPWAEASGATTWPELGQPAAAFQREATCGGRPAGRGGPAWTAHGALLGPRRRPGASRSRGSRLRWDGVSLGLGVCASLSRKLVCPVLPERMWLSLGDHPAKKLAAGAWGVAKVTALPLASSPRSGQGWQEALEKGGNQAGRLAATERQRFRGFRRRPAGSPASCPRLFPPAPGVRTGGCDRLFPAPDPACEHTRTPTVPHVSVHTTHAHSHVRPNTQSPTPSCTCTHAYRDSPGVCAHMHINTPTSAGCQSGATPHWPREPPCGGALPAPPPRHPGPGLHHCPQNNSDPQADPPRHLRTMLWVDSASLTVTVSWPSPGDLDRSGCLPSLPPSSPAGAIPE